MVVLAKLAQDLPSVDTGKGDIQDDEIGIEISNCFEPRVTIYPQIHPACRMTQTYLDDSTECRIIFYYENSLRCVTCFHNYLS